MQNENRTVRYCLHCRKSQQHDHPQTVPREEEESSDNIHTNNDTTATGLFKKCLRCKLACYCSRKCQKLNFSLHKDPCKRIFEMHKKLDSNVYPVELKNFMANNNNNKNNNKEEEEKNNNNNNDDKMKNDEEKILFLLSSFGNMNINENGDDDNAAAGDKNDCPDLLKTKSNMLQSFVMDKLNLATQIVRMTYFSTDTFQRGKEMYEVALHDHYLASLSLLLLVILPPRSTTTTGTSTQSKALQSTRKDANVHHDQDTTTTTTTRISSCFSSSDLFLSLTMQLFESITILLVAMGGYCDGKAFNFMIYGYKTLILLLPSICHTTTTSARTDTKETFENHPTTAVVSSQSIIEKIEQFRTIISLIHENVPSKQWPSPLNNGVVYSKQDDSLDQILPVLFPMKKKKKGNETNKVGKAATEQQQRQQQQPHQTMDTLVSLGLLMVLTIIYIRQLVPSSSDSEETGSPTMISALTPSALLQHNKNNNDESSTGGNLRHDGQNGNEDDEGPNNDDNSNNISNINSNNRTTPSGDDITPEVDDLANSSGTMNISNNVKMNSIRIKHNLKIVLSTLNSRNPLLPRLLLDKIPFQRADCFELFYHSALPLPVDGGSLLDDSGDDNDTVQDEQQRLCSKAVNSNDDEDSMVLPLMDDIYWYVLQDLLFLSPGVSSILDDYYPEQY